MNNCNLCKHVPTFAPKSFFFKPKLRHFYTNYWYKPLCKKILWCAEIVFGDDAFSDICNKISWELLVHFLHSEIGWDQYLTLFCNNRFGDWAEGKYFSLAQHHHDGTIVKVWDSFGKRIVLEWADWICGTLSFHELPSPILWLSTRCTCVYAAILMLWPRVMVITRCIHSKIKL